MPMNLLSLRAFSTQMIKIALEIKDPDIRALQAERQGKEYLQGGRLRSNAEAETNFSPKLAAIIAPGSSSRLGLMGMQEGGSSLQRPTPYEKMTDWGGTALKGALTGTGLVGVGHALRSHALHEEAFKPNYKHLRLGAGIGAAAFLGDRLYRRHLDKQKQAMMGSETFTPARSLHTSEQTGRFENKIHTAGGLHPALMGKAGRLPRP